MMRCSDSIVNELIDLNPAGLRSIFAELELRAEKETYDKRRDLLQAELERTDRDLQTNKRVAADINNGLVG